ncbi:alpha/beta hydrolase, partial [Caulobacter sp.]|uniref:alpha/beta fold hydrolase n=1 Tax=Caulobacter sp. TaxID=78 RepID=UPI002B4A3369
MSQSNQASRRGVMTAGFGLAAALPLAAQAATAQAATAQAPHGHGHAAAHVAGRAQSGFVATQDGVQIFYKDWGPKDAQPVVFHHGWPLSADDWDAQMMFFLGKGYRVIAHDRRGHGRSTQTDTGNEMDTYAADVIALADHLDLKNAIHVGHSTGGGEAIHYAARAKPGRVAKVVLIGAVPP